MSSRRIVATDRDLWRLTALVRTRIRAPAGRDDHLALLAEELARVTPVAPADVPAGVVTMNSRVRVRDIETGAVWNFTLVYPQESDLAAGRLSVLAPLGAALLGYRVGDAVLWQMPGGTRRLHIEQVRPNGSGGAPAGRSRRADGPAGRPRGRPAGRFDGAA